MQLTDIPKVLERDSSCLLGDALESAWNKEMKNKNKNNNNNCKTSALWRAILAVFGKELLITAFSAFIFECILM